MKSFAASLALFGSLFSIMGVGELMSQTKDGFYDTNNYDLRNLPGYDPEAEVLRDVEQPPSISKPSLASPKDVRTKYDPIASIPGAGALLPSQTQTTSSQNPYTNSALTRSPINPLTGEINPQALQNQNNRSRNKKEIQKKLREEFDEEAVYEETKFRRGYIIFFLTFPFALGASAALAASLLQAKTAIGSFIMLSGSIGLSGTNVYLDQQRLEEHRKNKKEKQREE
ncbi:hypothetical protein LPTSP4_27230 [Leptospira ryugenii]|uniref:Uncharacterized protein n=1 Tax=Leptospira ryugenii TaxID=1917863 RepID=A0A2P2E2V7_9LEPT|nr:hypothetical protein [Leptospira ryugenii]GBF51191.1 hypothetical protein LPTSP4_27230 [Leptospira ryugenii]